MTKKKLPQILILLASVLLFSGCPDYSHLRPVPDYENMVDGGGDDGSVGAEK